ncbi:hypothetical protein FIU95_07495 [Microbulbifer sp. THAF38]|nr:hypothetical protein FIU95_07495 [Microbulbifer sp. THAF38]
MHLLRASCSLRLLARLEEDVPNNIKSVAIASVNFPVAMLIAAPVKVSPLNNNVCRFEIQILLAEQYYMT